MNISSRFIGSAAIFGGSVWAISWFLQSQPDVGFRASLGLSEGNYRAIMNPMLVLIGFGMFGLYRIHKSRLNTAGLIGFWITGLSLGVWLVGNLLEFGLFGTLWLNEGWIVAILATIGILIGLVLLGLAFLNAKLLAPWSRSIPVLIAVISMAGFFMAEPTIFGVSFGIGWILLGYAVLSYETPPSGELLVTAS